MVNILQLIAEKKNSEKEQTPDENLQVSGIEP
jgi:hypothetical protein